MGYTLRETRFSIGEDFLVETESGEQAFKVNGKAGRARPCREGSGGRGTRG